MADTEGARRRRAPRRPGDESTDEPTAPAVPAGRARKPPGTAKKATKAAPAPAAAPAKRAPAAKKSAAAKKAAGPRDTTREAAGTPGAAEGADVRKAPAGKAPPLKAPARKPPARKAPARKAAVPEPPPTPDDEVDEPRPAFGRSGLRAVLAEAAARAAAERAAEGPAASSLASTTARPWSAPAEPAEPAVPAPAAPETSPPVTPAASEPEWRSTTAETAVLPQATAPAPPSAPAPSAPAPTTSPTTSPTVPPAAPTVPRPPSERRAKGGAGRTIGIIVGIALAVVVVAVLAFALIGKITDKGGIKYSELKAGDCLQRPSGSFNKVQTVACTKPHDLEVYALLDHPAAAKAPYTSTDDLIHYANPLCLAQFKAYAGVPFEQLNLQDFYITPRKSVWDDGVRRIVCVVGSGDNSKLNKSIKAGA